MSIFKAYDIRGIVPDQLDAGLAEKIGTAFTNIIQQEFKTEKVTILTAQDMRPSGIEIIRALHKGITKAGANVVHIGLATTPMFYYAVGLTDAEGGLTCTASHNPAQYNGFKLVRKNSVPVSADTGIKEIERRIQANELTYSSNVGEIRQSAIYPQYKQRILSFAQHREKKLKVAIDTANGMAGLYKEIFDEFNFEVIPLFFELDGSFPNHEANPLKPETLVMLQEKIKTEKADFGAAFDGDADRIIFLDEKAEIIPADFVTALLASKILAEKPGNSVVYDVRSSRIVAEVIKNLGGFPVRERVGHSFIKARMRQENAIFGGELSGHYYWKEMFTCDNAILTLVQIANILRESNKPLSELIKSYKKYYQSGETNFVVEDKEAMMKKLEQIFSDAEIDWLDGITIQYKNWWFNVRPSNTEPLLRLNLEADTPEELSKHLVQLTQILSK